MACANGDGDGRGVLFLFPAQQFIGLTAVDANGNASFPLLASVQGPPVALVNLGYSPPLSPLVGIGVSTNAIFQLEVERNTSLHRFMWDEGLFTSPDEEFKRKMAVYELKQIVMQWVKKVACQKQLPKNYIRDTSATIMTYGSYGLGVHNSKSDIDALCVGPCFATMAEDFFIGLHNMLARHPEVSEIHCVKDAKVPVMRFNFNGILIDLTYAQIKVHSVPENVDILNPLFLKDVDDISQKCLSGLRTNKSILQLVPDLEIYQTLLRCVKLWAKRRGVYGNLFGFFGGVHLAILVAFVCVRHPCGSLSALVSIFFETFAFWSWPTPVTLLNGTMPPFFATETRSLMPILLPYSPYEYCHSNITKSTFYRIRTEFRRGHALTKHLLRPDFDWASLFEAFPYSIKYARFLKICVSASNQDESGDWLGWTKSRFPSLIVKLEKVLGFCDPNPIESVDASIVEPNMVFYWGLQLRRSDFVDINSMEVEFKKHITKTYHGCLGNISLSIVNSSQLPKDI